MAGGIIIRNLSSAAFTNIRIGSKYPFPVYEYPSDDRYYIITPEPEKSSGTATSYTQDGFTFYGQGVYAAYYAVHHALQHEIDNNTHSWQSSNTGTRTGSRYIQITLPESFKIDAFRIVSGRTGDTTTSFRNGILYGLDPETESWENLFNIGNIDRAVKMVHDIIDLNLTKPYSAYRIVGQTVRHTTNYYMVLGRFHLLVKKYQILL